MIQQAMTAGAVAVAIALTPSARAEYVVGAPIIVPNGVTVITLEFVSADAAYTGEISFLGAGSDLLVTMPAADTGPAGLGQQLFVNQNGATGNTIVLEGVYAAGDTLHFGYRVFEPSGQEDLFRTDNAADVDNFAWDEEAGLLHIEDLRPGHPWYDADYNDIIVRVSFTIVPAPASALALIAGGTIGFGRRRREA